MLDPLEVPGVVACNGEGRQKAQGDDDESCPQVEAPACVHSVQDLVRQRHSSEADTKKPEDTAITMDKCAQLASSLDMEAAGRGLDQNQEHHVQGREQVEAPAHACATRDLAWECGV